MTRHSLLYVSKSTLSEGSASGIVHEIAASSVEANKRVDITGALIFTGSYFAQILEGSRGEIDKLMAAIRKDSRHEELKIVERKDISERRFPSWSMAYMGPSQFVSRHVMRLLEEPGAEREWLGAKWMGDLMAEFSTVS